MFCRELLGRHGIAASPKVATPTTVDEVERAIAELGVPFVVKPDGLTAGKGVWVQGSDFTEPKEGAVYAKSLLLQGGRVLLEEKLDGEEFSQMAFVTDSGIYPMPAVQDFKRALEGNRGGNTGGMGSYSQRDHLLPFLSASDRDAAIEIVRRTVDALRAEGISYRGVLYGGFMLTARGPVLVEYNARFGDPEGINAMTLYEEGNFAELLEGVARGRVDPNLVQYRLRSTVVKYPRSPRLRGPPEARRSPRDRHGRDRGRRRPRVLRGGRGRGARDRSARPLSRGRARGRGERDPRGRDPGRGRARPCPGRLLRPPRYRDEGGPLPSPSSTYGSSAHRGRSRLRCPSASPRRPRRRRAPARPSS